MGKKYPETKNIEIPKKTLGKWQESVNILAEIMKVPAALIMRVFPPEIEVFSASDTAENPYEVGDREKLLGLYCEEVIQNDKELLVADAREIERWKNNPDIKLDMVSYFGFPLKWPDGDTFGTICVLDSKKNEYSGLFRKTMIQFKELIESHLELIFKRREVETEKERAEEYLEAAGPIVVILNKDGVVRRINKRGSEILNYNKEEIEGKNWFENFIPERSRKNVRDVFEKIISGDIEALGNAENPVLVGGGGEKIILWHNNILKNEKGKIVDVISSGIDITERKEVQKRLRESEKEKSLILNGTPMLIDYQNTKHEIIWANKAAAESVGKKPEELVGKKCHEVWSQRDIPCEGCPVEKAIEKGELESGEISSPDGRIWFIKANPVVDEKGDIIGVIEITMNITERKKAEEELKKTKERYQKIVENANEWIWILDKEGNFTYANRAAIEDSGYKFENWLGKSFEPIVVEGELSKIKRIFVETLGGKSQNYEVRIKDNRGNIRTLKVNTAPLLEEGEAVGTVSVGRDVTVDKEKEKELIKMDKLESLGVLAGGIAHDFNNLLMGIMGNLSLASMNIDDDDEVKELLSDATKASKEASLLTEQLLTFSKGGEPVKEKISMKDIIIESSEFVLHGSNVKCEYNFPENFWNVTADKGQMFQVINNIVLNADQSMPEGGKISITGDNIILGSDNTLPLPKGKHIKISIKDEGMGIPEEHLNKIFDPFFSTKTKGHGLGMTTVYSIIQKHEGHVKVESKLGEGTTFYIYLPAVEKDNVEREEEKEEVFLIGKKKILLMDDEEIVRKILGRMLKEKGSKVVFAENGKEAVKKFKKAKNTSHTFDVVILDLTIPGGMGGKETLKEIRKIDPDVKIIVSSGYSNDPIMANYEKYGFDGVIAKPFNIEELIRVLKDVIGKG
jgi:two-component system cell cycle sensor histidine kinase/response regulator CckA